MTETTLGQKEVLVLGGSGMLGSEVVLNLEGRGHAVVSPSHSDLDVTHFPHIKRLAEQKYGTFQWIVNCTGYTAVDDAEQETAAAMKLNGVAPGTLAAVCAQTGTKLLHISTDFVFDGTATCPYTEDSLTAPLGSYGQSKLFGEQKVFENLPSATVLRTSWLFGPRGKCFPRSMIAAWLSKKELRVVGDQTGTPTSATELARVIGDCLDLGLTGLYHAAGPDVTTWFEFAELALQTYREAVQSQEEVKIERIETADWPTAAKRPVYSPLDSSKLWATGITPMAGTKEALAVFCQRLVSSGGLTVTS